MDMTAVYDWFGYEMSDEKRYKLIKNSGFDGVMLWWSSCFGRGDGYKSSAELARKAGLYIENIHAPIERQNALWLDGINGTAAFDEYLECIADCAEREIGTMAVHLPSDDFPCTELGLERVKKIAEFAERYSVNIALENLNNFFNLGYILEQVDSPRVGFCYDVCHHYNCCPNEDLLAMYGERLMALHLHDNGGERNQHRLPFAGKIDWFSVMKKITRTGYSGAAALEPMNWDYTYLTAEEFLRTAFKRAKSLDDMMSRYITELYAAV